MDLVTLGLVVVGAICLVAIFYKPKETKVEAPVAQESAPAVEPAKEVTSVASKPARAKKPAAAKPVAKKPAAAKKAPAKKAPAKATAKKPTTKAKKSVAK